jgi:triple functional domain protein
MVNGEADNFRTPDAGNTTSFSLSVDCSFNWKTSYDTDYAKISEISRGRYSIVRRCVDTRTAAEVAAKCINKNLTTRNSVITEVSVMRKLKHPSLVQPLHLYDSNNAYVVILPILPHGRLFEYICTKMQFDEYQAVNFIFLLLDAVQYLHNCRIAHLDIKPENLLVDLSGSSPLLKLIDFGDAHQIYDNQYIHLLIGSPEFAAPELVTRKPVGLFSDIWSVGVVTYVMMSGVSPFLDESLDETCGNIVKRDFCYPDEYFARISPEAKDFISFLLASEPSSRPSAKACLEHAWITKGRSHRSASLPTQPIPTARLIDFIERRRHQNDVTPVKYVR